VNPSISVVTVTLNAAKYLPRLIGSLREQTDREFDYVVIDGASKDSTWDVVQASRDVVTYALCESDKSFFDALNKAVRALRTDYYVVMGADDTLYADAIANFKAVVRKSGADVVVADVKVGGTNTTLRGFHPRRAWRGAQAMVTAHSVGMLFRTKLHEQFGEYSYRYTIEADVHFIKRVCTASQVKTVSGNFVSGEFAPGGFSHQNVPRTLCELWLVQLETNENPLKEYLLFQYRLLRYLLRIIAGKRLPRIVETPAVEVGVASKR